MEKKQVMDPHIEAWNALSVEERAKRTAEYDLAVKARWGTDAEREVANAILKKQKKAKKEVVCARCEQGGNLREVEDQQGKCFIICRGCWVEALDNEEYLHNCCDDWTDDEEDEEEQ
jgi:hypothetical protein